MRLGTKSILFGVHCFFLHPLFVAWAWRKLYGFPFDPRLWVAFFVHDLGYWGLSEMDSEEGEDHVFLGAEIMGFFDGYERAWAHGFFSRTVSWILDKIFGRIKPWPGITNPTWYCFTFYHSRFMAKRYGTAVSPLCVADKLSFCLTPAWLYLPMARATGELYEYMERHRDPQGKYAHYGISSHDAKDWHTRLRAWMQDWVDKNKDAGMERPTEASR